MMDELRAAIRIATHAQALAFENGRCLSLPVDTFALVTPSGAVCEPVTPVIVHARPSFKLQWTNYQKERRVAKPIVGVVSKIFRTFIMRRLRFQIGAADRVAAYS